MRIPGPSAAAALTAPAKAPRLGRGVLAAFALTATGLVAWHYYFSLILFSGMDGGALINAAWMQCHGVVPYRDFYTATPPLWVLPAGWAFAWFGPFWTSFSLLFCLFSLVTFTWMFVVLQRMSGHAWKALAGALVIQVLALLPLSWWWYNDITAMIAALFYASVCGLYFQPESRLLRASFVLSEAVLALGKANMAGPLLVLGVLFLLFRKPLRRFVIVATLAAAAADIGVLALNHISVPSLLQNYAWGGSGRFQTRIWSYFFDHPEGFTEHAITTAWIIASIAAGVALIFACDAGGRRKKDLLALFSIAQIVSVIDSATNFAWKGECVVYLIILVFFVFPPRLSPPFGVAGMARWTSVIAMGAAIFLTILLGGSRKVFLNIGNDSYAPPEMRYKLMAPPLFRGMQTSWATVNALYYVNAALKDLNWPANPNQTIYFGPFIDFCYAAFNIPPPRGLPLWWENVPSTRPPFMRPNEGLPPWRYPQLPRTHAVDPRVQRFFDEKFSACFFWVDDSHKPNMAFVPEDIRYELSRDYTLTYYHTIALYKRKAP